MKEVGTAKVVVAVRHCPVMLTMFMMLPDWVNAEFTPSIALWVYVTIAFVVAESHTPAPANW